MTVDSAYLLESRKPDADTVYTFVTESIGESTIDLWRLATDGTWTSVDPGSYTLAMGGESPIYFGGQIDFVEPLEGDDTLQIERNTPITQLADFVDGQSFPSEVSEFGLDKLTYILQEIDGEKCDCRGECVQISILDQPENFTGVEGETATFTVNAGGTTPFVYQWYQDDAAMPGEITDTLTFVIDAVNKLSSYYVIVSNACSNPQSDTVSVIASCIQYGLSETVTQLTEIWRSADSLNSSGLPNAFRQVLRGGGPIAVNNDEIWQIEIVDPVAFGKNRLRYSNNYLATSALVARPYDDWWAGLDPSYDTKQQQSGYTWMRRSGGTVWLNYFWEGNNQFAVCRTVGGTTAPTVEYSSYSVKDKREYTAANAKIRTHGYAFTMNGALPFIGGKSNDTGGWMSLGATERVDGSAEDPFAVSVPASTYTVYNQYRVPPYDNYDDNCYQLARGGGRVFKGSADSTMWAYNTYVGPAETEPQTLQFTEWDGNGWQYTDEPLSEWRFESVGDFRRNSVLSEGEYVTRENWVETVTGNVMIPLTGYVDTGDANFATWREFLVSDPGPPPVLAERDLDYSSLIASSVGTETTLTTLGLAYCENASKYIFYWCYGSSTNSEDRPVRFYMRVSDTVEVADFSPPLRVDHYNIWQDAPLASDTSGGYRIDYSKSRNQYVVSSLHMIGSGQWRQITGVIDDVFFCEVFA